MVFEIVNSVLFDNMNCCIIIQEVIVVEEEKKKKELKRWEWKFVILKEKKGKLEFVIVDVFFIG